MCSNKDLTRLFTGGADGKIIIWDENLKPIKELLINTPSFQSMNPVVRALNYDEVEKKLLVGTRGGEIV